MLDLSVIIPCYNCAKFVRESILSALNSDAKEVIAINDGSTDETLKILCELESEFTNLHVINRENGGVGSARNAGINAASGKYLAFLDGDDIFEPNTLQELVTLGENTDTDIVFGDFNYLKNNEKIYTKNYDCQDGLIDKDAYLKAFFTARNDTFACVWGKIIRRDFLQHEKITFLENIFMAEDVNFSAKVLWRAEKIAKLNHAVINYRIGDNNESKKLKLKNFQDVRICDKDLREFLQTFKLSEEKTALISCFSLILRYKAILTLRPFSFQDYTKATEFTTSDISNAPKENGFNLLPKKLQVLVRLRIALGNRLYSLFLYCYYLTKDLL